jgi:hypothetical protein
MPRVRICLRVSLIASLLTAPAALAAAIRPIELTVGATDAPRANPAQRAGRGQPRAEAEGRCPGKEITTPGRPVRPREL